MVSRCSSPHFDAHEMGISEITNAIFIFAEEPDFDGSQNIFLCMDFLRKHGVYFVLCFIFMI
jgi:hypothetical protein